MTDGARETIAYSPNSSEGGDLMEGTVTALLVGLDGDLFCLLKLTLEQLGMETDSLLT